MSLDTIHQELFVQRVFHDAPSPSLHQRETSDNSDHPCYKTMKNIIKKYAK